MHKSNQNEFLEKVEKSHNNDSNKEERHEKYESDWSESKLHDGSDDDKEKEMKSKIMWKKIRKITAPALFIGHLKTIEKKHRKATTTKRNPPEYKIPKEISRLSLATSASSSSSSDSSLSSSESGSDDSGSGIGEVEVETRHERLKTDVVNILTLSSKERLFLLESETLYSIYQDDGQWKWIVSFMISVTLFFVLIISNFGESDENRENITNE